MNVLGKYVSVFRIQHEALARLKAIKPKPRASATKLYCWLAFKGIHVQQDVEGIMKGTGLHEGAVVNTRRTLDTARLIHPEFSPGRGATYGHSILNAKTGQPLDWDEKPQYFQVPESLMFKEQYTKLGGTALLVYLAVLASVNKKGPTGHPEAPQALDRQTRLRGACCFWMNQWPKQLQKRRARLQSLTLNSIGTCHMHISQTFLAAVGRISIEAPLLRSSR